MNGTRLSWLSHANDLDIVTLETTLSSSSRYTDSARAGWLGVSILWARQQVLSTRQTAFQSLRPLLCAKVLDSTRFQSILFALLFNSYVQVETLFESAIQELRHKNLV